MDGFSLKKETGAIQNNQSIKNEQKAQRGNRYEI